jgi:outer membrane lipoprotein carrier protein
MMRGNRLVLALRALALVLPIAALAAAQAPAPGPAPSKGASKPAEKAPAKAPEKAAPKSTEKAAPKPSPKAPEKPSSASAKVAETAPAKAEEKGAEKPVEAAKGPEAKGKLSEAEVTAAVARVQANYEKVRAFRARFKQDYWVKAYDQRKKSTGAVVFARPGKMSWAYDEPKGNRVVSDGKLLRVYEESSKQLFEQPVDKSQYPQALGFLTGESKLAETFTFEASEGASMNFPGGIVLVATPKQPLASVQKVLLYVDAATHYVRRVLLLDAQGNRNRFDFDDVKLDEAIDAREFVFNAPAGTTVIHP